MLKSSAKSLKVVAFLLLASLVIAAPALAGEGVEKHLLSNGLTLLVKENRSARVVALYLWVKAGSANETEDEAGISHVFEHMLFKGTERRKLGELAREVEARGGDINAFTSFDHTVYYVVISSRYLDTALDVLSDAAFNSSFDAGELEKEKEVVLEEWRQGEDRPASRLWKRLMATAYGSHPYGRPVIGYERTIRSLTRQQMLDYFTRWYRPENMVLVIGGDVDPKEVLAKAERAFGSYRGAQAFPPPSPATLPEGRNGRAFVLSEQVSEAYIALAFPIPAVGHPDVPALDALALIVGQGESSRLYRRVKDEKGLVHTISADSMTPKGPGLFEVSGSLEPEKLKEALKETITELLRVRYYGVSSSELEKAKTQLLSTATYEKETVQGDTKSLGYFESVLGDFRKEDEYYRAVGALGPEDIKRVAETYLDEGSFTVGSLIPKGTVSISDEELKGVATSAFREARDQFAKAVGPVESIGRFVLDNGITLIVRENRGVPTVAVQAVFLGGVRLESPATNGVSNLAAEMLTRGTSSRDAEEIAREVESMAASLSGFSGRNSFGVSATFLSQHFERGLALVADAVLNSGFPEAELEKVKKDVFAAIKRREDDPARLAFLHFGRTLFRNHPYGLDPLGTVESVAGLTRRDVGEHYRRYALPQNLTLAISGDVDVENARRLAQRLFGGMGGGRLSVPVVPQERPLREPRVVKLRKEKKQVNLVLGFLGPDLRSEDKYPLEVLSAVLSGQGGRLFMEVRDRRGLAYSIYSFFRPGYDAGYFGVYVATAPEKYGEALEGILRELKRVTEEEVTPEELRRATQYLAGEYEIDLQSNRSYASTMAFDEAYGLGYDYFKGYPERLLRVTAGEVLAAARKYINLSGYAMAVVGPVEGR